MEAAHQEAPLPAPAVFQVVPVTRREVRDFIRRRHSHDIRPGALFRLGVAVGDCLAAVAVVGRPHAHVTTDRLCAEVLRIGWDRGYGAAAVGAIYRAIGESVRAMGYRQLITYGDHGHDVAELRAAGWQFVREVPVIKYAEAAAAAGVRLAERWLWTADEQ